MKLNIENCCDYITNLTLVNYKRVYIPLTFVADFEISNRRLFSESMIKRLFIGVFPFLCFL